MNITRGDFHTTYPDGQFVAVSNLPLVALQPLAVPTLFRCVVTPIDARGRLADGSPARILDWAPGQPVSITAVPRPPRVTLDQLMQTQQEPLSAIPTFAQYIPIVSATVSAGTCQAYSSYWNRVAERWGDRRIDDACTQ